MAAQFIQQYHYIKVGEQSYTYLVVCLWPISFEAENQSESTHGSLNCGSQRSLSFVRERGLCLTSSFTVVDVRLQSLQDELLDWTVAWILL